MVPLAQAPYAVKSHPPFAISWNSHLYSLLRRQQVNRLQEAYSEIIKLNGAIEAVSGGQMLACLNMFKI